MKKIVGSVIITCMILMSLCNICYASTTFQPSITAECGSVGDTITVTVSIPANTNAAGGSFNLIYDNTKMELVDATAGDIISAFSKTVNKTYAANKVRLNFAGSETVSASGGIILNASFKLTAAGTATFSTEKFKLADIDTNYLTCENASKSITVSAASTTVAVTGVSLNKASTTLTVGGTEILTATIAPSTATNKNVSWTSSNASVASVSNGVITAKAAGTATITVTTEDGSKTATCLVTVEDVNTTYDAYVYTEAKKTVVQGSQFTYKVCLAGTYDGYSFEIIPAEGITITNITAANNNINVDELSNKWMVSVLGGLEKNNSEKEEIVAVTVLVDADAELGERTLNLSNVMLSNDIGDKVSKIKYEYASINITDQIPGDVNGDGIFDYFDVSKLYAFYRGKTTLADSAQTDINGDDTFDYFDVSKLYAIYRNKATFN